MVLTAERQTDRKDGKLLEIPMAKEVATIWKGSIVMYDANGFAVVGLDTTGCQFAGIAFETKVITVEDAADGDTMIRVFRDGIFLLDTPETLLRATHIGCVMYICDDESVDFKVTSTNDIACGVIADIDADAQPWLDISGYAPLATAAGES